MLRKIWHNETTGYDQVSLYKDGKFKTHSLHVLVLSSFIPKPIDKDEVNHKDGNKTNNKINNLEWVTDSENMIHAFKVLKRTRTVYHGPHTPPKDKVLPKGIGKRGNKFLVRISNHHKRSCYDNLGLHDTVEQAMEVYKKAHIDKYGIDPYNSNKGLEIVE